MVLDQVENFIRVSVAGTHTSGASTIALETGETAELPLVTNGKYNLVWFDASGFAQPDADPNVEIVRVNSINTNNDTISVTRGVENTTATAKDTGTNYELLLTPTAKIIEDIDANKLDTNQRYTDGEAVSAITGEVIRPEQSIHSNSIDSNLNIGADNGLVLAGPLTSSSTITGDGRMVIPGGSPDFQSSSFTDSDAVNAVNAESILSVDISGDADTIDGLDSTAFLQTTDTIDADTVNGQTASDFGGVISTFVAVGVNEGNINSNRNIDWSNETTNTGSYSFDGRNITISSNGIYEVRSDIDFESSNQSRANPNIFIEKNGSTVGVGGRSGYMRDAEGHNHSSIHASFIGSLSSGDDIRVRASRDADGGTVSPERGHLYIKRIE